MEEFREQEEKEMTQEEAGGMPEETCEGCGNSEETAEEAKEAGEEPNEAAEEATREGCDEAEKNCDEAEKTCGEEEASGGAEETCGEEEACGEEETCCEEKDAPPKSGNAEEEKKACEARAFREASMEKLDRLLTQMTETGEAVSGQLEALDKLFKSRIMHTDHEEKIVDQMHRELQKYREDLYAQLIRPVLLDVIEVREDMCKVIAGIMERPEEERKVPVSELEIYEQYLQDILEKNNVVLHRSEAGNAFVPIQQRIVKKVATEDESLHGKVSQSLSDGYEYGGRTIAAEKVAVFFYSKPAEK